MSFGGMGSDVEPKPKSLQTNSVDSTKSISLDSQTPSIEESAQTIQASPDDILRISTASQSFNATDENVDPLYGSPQELRNHPRYRLIRRLGRGGMGTVWLATHLVMNRPVALKVIRPDLLSNPEVIARFRREVQAAAKLHHPNVVTAFDAEQIGGTHFLVVEYVEGQTLSELVSKGPLPIEEACQAIRDVALGLSHAHATGLIHRDVKPGNMIRTQSGVVKVLDFGMVIDPNDESSITGDSIVMGTPDYVAPEQALNPSTADQRSDIYSLGCTFYHLINGKAPFASRPLLNKIDAHRYLQPEPLKFLPPELELMLLKMMAKRPDDRFQSAQEIIEVLDVYCKPRSHALDGARSIKALTPPRKTRRIAILSGIAAAGVVLTRTTLVSSPLVRRDEQKRRIDLARVPLPTVSTDKDDGLPPGRRFPMLKPTAIGDGSPKDWSVDGKLLSLNAMEHWQVWLNFDYVHSSNLIIRTYLRARSAKQESNIVKFVFLSDTIGEYSLELPANKSRAQLKSASFGQPSLSLANANSTSNAQKQQWDAIEFRMHQGKIAASINGQVLLNAHCNIAKDFRACLAVQNCLVDFFDPRVIAPDA